MLNYRDDITIDETALDIEWLAQPGLMADYGQLQADARKELDLAKEALLVIDAEISHEIRADPEAFSIEKVTEKLVESTIILDDRHKKAMRRVIDAQHEYASAQAAVTAFEHRKHALENMSRLLGLNYFATPVTPRDLPKEVQERQNKKREVGVVKIKPRKNKKGTRTK